MNYLLQRFELQRIFHAQLIVYRLTIPNVFQLFAMLYDWSQINLDSKTLSLSMIFYSLNGVIFFGWFHWPFLEPRLPCKVGNFRSSTRPVYIQSHIVPLSIFIQCRCDLREFIELQIAPRDTCILAARSQKNKLDRPEA